MRICLLFCLALVFASARADEIVAIKRESNLMLVHYRNRGVLWNLNSGVCLYRNRNKATCGRIVKISDKHMLLKLTDDGAKRLGPGEYIELNASDRVPAAIQATVGTPRHDNIDLGIGIAGAFNYFYPTLKFGVALSRYTSLGIEPFYVSFTGASTSAKAYGGFLTFNYFLTQKTFRGLYATAGVGVYSLSLTNAGVTEDLTPIAFEGLLQWRGGGHWSLGLDVTFGAGFQYVGTKTALLTTTFQGVLPLFAFTLGTSF